MSGPDEEESEGRTDRETRFSNIASRIADEFGSRSEDSGDTTDKDEPPDTDDDAREKASDLDAGVNDWEWFGGGESEDSVNPGPSAPDANDTSDQRSRGGRLWNNESKSDVSTEDSRADGDRTANDTNRTATDVADVDRTAADTADVDRTAADTADVDRTAADTADVDRTAADTADTANTSEISSDTGAGDRAEETGGRIWTDTAATESAAATETDPSPSEGGMSAESPPAGPTAGTDASGSTEETSVLDRKQFDPGTNVLIQSESRSDRTQNGCHELLFGREENPDPHLLLIRYQQVDGEQLERIASEGHQIHVIAVGYAQSVPPAAERTVTVTQINNPNDITRLGIVVSRITQGWSDDGREIRVCYGSLNVLLNYRDVKNVFRFLHVFLSTFTKADAVAHFHADPLEGDPQAINTLKPLFDEVISMDSTGTYVE